MARTHGHGNPKWTRDETILALDLYFECAGNIPSSDDARLQKLSNLLRRLPYHSAASKKESFRNPDGVAFKLQNIRQVATGKGLGNVSEMDRAVWAEFGSNRDKVKELASLIQAGVAVAESFQDAPESLEDEFFEGRVLTEVHKRRERDAKLRERLLTLRRRMGRLTCDLCRAHSQSGDPMLEDASFEVHHLVPLCTTTARKTLLSDVALFCANCHRLLHRAISIKKRWLSITEGLEIIGFRNRN